MWEPKMFDIADVKPAPKCREDDLLKIWEWVHFWVNYFFEK